MCAPWYNIGMTIEFYGEVSEYTKVRVDKIRKRYFAKWIGALAAVLALAAVIAAFFSSSVLLLLIFAGLLAAVAAWLAFSPLKKSMEKERWLFRVTIGEEDVTFVQYLPGKEVRKVKKFNDVKRVVKTKYCYLIVFNDIANAFVCERQLLKRGTLDAFERLFEGKIRARDIP